MARSSDQSLWWSIYLVIGNSLIKLSSIDNVYSGALLQISILLLTVVLLAILGLSGWIKQRKQYASFGALPPYRVRKAFLNTQEFAYYNALKQALGDDFQVYPKVRVPQILSHPGHDPQFRVHWSRVQRRFVDFLVCDSSLKPALAVKFDPTANRRHKHPKEDILEDALGAAELPLLRVMPANNYDLDEITYKIKFAMARHEPQVNAYPERSKTVDDDSFVDSENENTDSRFLRLRRWTSDLWMASRRSN